MGELTAVHRVAGLTLTVGDRGVCHFVTEPPGVAGFAGRHHQCLVDPHAVLRVVTPGAVLRANGWVPERGAICARGDLHGAGSFTRGDL